MHQALHSRGPLGAPGMARPRLQDGRQQMNDLDQSVGQRTPAAQSGPVKKQKTLVDHWCEGQFVTSAEDLRNGCSVACHSSAASSSQAAYQSSESRHSGSAYDSGPEYQFDATSSSISISSAASSPCKDDYSIFLQLPPEVRNEIYKLLFRGIRVTTLNDPGMRQSKVSPGILRTCRKCNQDAKPVFYSEVTLRLSILGSIPWLSTHRSTKDWKCIQKLYLDARNWKDAGVGIRCTFPQLKEIHVYIPQVLGEVPPSPEAVKRNPNRYPELQLFVALLFNSHYLVYLGWLRRMIDENPEIGEKLSLKIVFHLGLIWRTTDTNVTHRGYVDMQDGILHVTSADGAYTVMQRPLASRSSSTQGSAVGKNLIKGYPEWEYEEPEKQDDGADDDHDTIDCA